MATIRKKKDRYGLEIGWQVMIRRQGYPNQYKTFRTKAEAEQWAVVIESEMVRGVFVNRTEAEQTLLSELLDRYESEVLPYKRSVQPVQSVIRIVKQYLGMYSVAAITPTRLAAYRNERLGLGLSSQTVRHELSLLSRVFNIAIKEWGIAMPMGNPVYQIQMPPPSKARDRRLVHDEYDRLFTALSKSRNPWLLPVVLFAIETGARAGELLETKKKKLPDGTRPSRTTGLLWKDVQLKNKTALVRDTKNNTDRVIPLSTTAIRILENLPHSLDGKVFGTTYEAIYQSFGRACQCAEIKNLRIHDLRHEATSRFFEKGLEMMEVAKITGHKNLQMLMRYTHLQAEKLAEKLG